LFFNAPNFVTICVKQKLSDLKMGESGVIHSFENDEIFLKLMEMGCIPGELITVEQIAPLGDPISISVAGYQLSLRMNEADSIFISPNLDSSN
jgi:ferrous iron transport protein A